MRYFLFLLENSETTKILVYFDYQTLNSLCSCHQYVNSSSSFCVVLSISILSSMPLSDWLPYPTLSILWIAYWHCVVVNKMKAASWRCVCEENLDKVVGSCSHGISRSSKRFLLFPFNELTSVFHASLLLLIMNFVIILSKYLWTDKIHYQQQDRSMKNSRQFVKLSDLGLLTHRININSGVCPLNGN